MISLAACMCMPNVALYGGALNLIAPEKKPSKGKGKGKGKETTMAPEVREISFDREPTRSPRATVSKEGFIQKNKFCFVSAMKNLPRTSRLVRTQ